MSYNYDAKGRFYRYDALGRAIASGAAASGGSANSKNWQLTLYSYDNQGRLISKEIHTQDKPELETVMDYTYNHLGEVTKQHVQVGSQHLYHFYAYNHLGQLANVYTNTTDALPATPEVTYAYNESGQLVREDIQGQTKADLNYRYDLKGRLDQLNNGDNSFTEDLSYNPDGTIASTAFTNGGLSYSYSYRYDDRGRLTEADYSEGTTKFDVGGLSYDAHGNLKTLNRYVDPSIIDSLVYTHLTGTNKLASVTDHAVPAATAATTGLVIYDESLHVPWINASWGATVTFGSAEQASAGATSIRVDQGAWGGLSVHHGNWGASQDLDPADYEMLSFDIYGSGNELILDVRLENDAGQSFPRISLGTITPGQWTRVEVAMSELNPNGYLFHRIDILESSGAPLTYYVDEWGLLDIRQAMVAVDWDAEDASFSWDAAGNMLSNSGRGITNIGYDTRNLPVSMSLNNGLETFYRYNSAGWRIHKRVEDNGVPSVDEHYIKDGGTLLAVTDSSGAVQFWNIYGNGLIGRREADSTKKYYLRDHLGSTRQVIDDSGALLEYYDYYPFGLVLRSNVAGQQTKETFTGKEKDEATGYYYFGARYYDAALAGWGTIDPAGQFHSPYLYAGNNPVFYTDPNGEIVPLLVVVGAAVVGGGINLATNWKNVDNVWEGLGYFGAGAASGALATTGPAGWAAGGAITGASNAALGGGDLGSVIQGGVVGSISGLAGGYGGQLASGFGGVVINGLQINSPFVSGAITGALGGAGGGFAGGATGAALTGGNVLEGGLQGALTGTAIGGGIGAGSASIQAYRSGYNPFTGKIREDYVFRAIRYDEAISIAEGRGISAKNSLGSWTLEEHLIYGPRRQAWANDPWISTTRDLNIARSFNSGNGIIGIDLGLVNNPYKIGYYNLPRSSPGYHFSIWQQEVSIYRHVPQSAIYTEPVLPRPIIINLR